jgi:KipI family sensor histidine kinase inhibitor
MLDLVPLGDRALLARFDDENAARLWARSAETHLGSHPGICDIVLAYRSVAVYADPDLCALDGLAEELGRLSAAPLGCEIGVLIEVPVLYDGADLAEVANHFGRTIPELIRLHSRPVYHVFAIGFLPGFAYAGYLPDEITGLPRRDTPRGLVPSGSVAIVGRQTGIYPQSSPGGWHLLGRTPLVVADTNRRYFPIRAGDSLRFRPIAPQEYESRVGEWLRVERTSSGLEPTPAEN